MHSHTPSLEVDALAAEGIPPWSDVNRLVPLGLFLPNAGPPDVPAYVRLSCLPETTRILFHMDASRCIM